MARLITMSTAMPRTSRLSLRPTTKTAAKRPKMAPDAPTVGWVSGSSQRPSTEPPSALTR